MTPNEKPASPTQALAEALERCIAYISSPVRMSRDEDETARRARLIQDARAALDRTTLPPTEEGMVMVPREFVDFISAKAAEDPVFAKGYEKLSIARARELLAMLFPSGMQSGLYAEYVRAPREPTPKMTSAGSEVAGLKSSEAAAVYRAMLAAANAERRK